MHAPKVQRDLTTRIILMKLSFVIPVYNERDSLETLIAGIVQYADPHTLQVLFVDDGSTDGSAAVLDSLKDIHPFVEVIRFRGNRGKSAALAAGFARATGDVVFTMDADLQDDPKEIPRFLERIEGPCDVVCGWKQHRHDPLDKTLPSRIYNSMVAWIFGVELHDINCGFKAYRREVVQTIPMYGELHRLTPVLALQEGFRIAEIPVEHHPRKFGVSKYGFERFIRGASDVLSVWYLTRFRYAPGHFFTGIGFGFLGLTALFSFWMFLADLLNRPASMLIGLLLMLGAGLGGVILVAAGLLAELVVRVQWESIRPFSAPSVPKRENVDN